MHIVFQITEHASYVLIFVLGLAFWLAVIAVIALAIVTDRVISGIINGDDDKRDRDGDMDDTDIRA